MRDTKYISIYIYLYSRHETDDHSGTDWHEKEWNEVKETESPLSESRYFKNFPNG